MDRLVDEAAAVLEGRVSQTSLYGGAVPRWARLNQLAHGTWQDLGQFAAEPQGPGAPWDGAVSFLAGEIRAHTGSPEVLLDFQRQALIPLELEILAGRASPADSPIELVSTVRAELARFCRREPRTSGVGGP